MIEIYLKKEFIVLFVLNFVDILTTIPNIEGNLLLKAQFNTIGIFPTFAIKLGIFILLGYLLTTVKEKPKRLVPKLVRIIFVLLIIAFVVVIINNIYVILLLS